MKNASRIYRFFLPQRTLRMRKQRALQPVDALLSSLFRDLGISDRIRLDALRRQWRTIFSGSISMHTAPAELKESRLVISVDSPAWLQHLKFLQKEIIAKITSHGIRTIQFRLGSVRLDEERPIPEKIAPPEAFRELTDADIDRINEAVEAIEDPELKTAVRQTMEKAARRKM